MQAIEPQNLAFHWSTIFARTLFEQGIRNVIISPGSRSTPLTLAFTTHPGFSNSIVLDERSAAFMALGQAKVSGMPSVLVCTSGTALANYHPAVEEATASGIPMIIASADRPPHLRGVGASQTIDQVKIFPSVVFYHEAGEPNLKKQGIDRIKTAAKQCIYYSTSRSGVAHVNFPFSKPLEPDADFLRRIEEENVNHSKRRRTNYNLKNIGTQLGEKFWSQLISAENPVFIAGPEHHFESNSFITELAKVLNAPILVEPGSNVPSSKYTITGFSGFLRSTDLMEELEPDLILRFGAFPVSKALSNYLEYYPGVHQITFSHKNNWRDGSFPSHRHILIEQHLEIPDITGNAQSSWLKRWKNLEKLFKQKRTETIQPSSPLTDGYVFNHLAALLPKKSYAMLSNSFPIRDMALFGDYNGKNFFVNRGAAGIDGIISTAIGISQTLKTSGVLFIGDLAFLHDVNALLSAKYIDHPLVIVILNNGGGTIFRMLPVYKMKEKHQMYFETPQDVRIASICRGYHIDHLLVSRPEQLIPAFENCLEKSGVHVIECITDADDSMIERHKLWNFSEDQ